MVTNLLFALQPGSWYRDTIIAGLVILGLAVYFVRATATRQGERTRRLRLGLLALVGSPLLGLLIAGVSHAFIMINPLDVGDHYTKIIGIGGIVGLTVGLFFLLTSLLSSNDPASSRRKLIP